MRIRPHGFRGAGQDEPKAYPPEEHRLAGTPSCDSDRNIALFSIAGAGDAPAAFLRDTRPRSGRDEGNAGANCGSAPAARRRGARKGRTPSAVRYPRPGLRSRLWRRLCLAVQECRYDADPSRPHVLLSAPSGCDARAFETPACRGARVGGLCLDDSERRSRGSRPASLRSRIRGDLPLWGSGLLHPERRHPCFR